MGSKLVSGSYFTFVRCGAIRNAVEVISKVLPSGAARDTASVPMTALAPGRFSVNKVTPSVRLICSPRIRARMSAVPPAGYGTTILTVLAVCEHAAVSPWRMERAPATIRYGDRRLGRFMMMPPVRFRGEADMHRGMASCASVEDDPKRTCAADGTATAGDCACLLGRSHSSIKENQYPGTQ